MVQLSSMPNILPQLAKDHRTTEVDPVFWTGILSLSGGKSPWYYDLYTHTPIAILSFLLLPHLKSTLLSLQMYTEPCSNLQQHQQHISSGHARCSQPYVGCLWLAGPVMWSWAAQTDLRGSTGMAFALVMATGGGGMLNNRHMAEGSLVRPKVTGGRSNLLAFGWFIIPWGDVTLLGPCTGGVKGHTVSVTVVRGCLGKRFSESEIKGCR